MNTLSPLLTIIVPVYKVEDYLETCINSILNQDFTDYELILVDDGSPDNCGKICDEYAGSNSKIKVIHKENGGQSSARNAGLDIAQGEYVWFIDSDDEIEPDCLKTLMDQLVSESLDLLLFPFKIAKNNHISDASSDGLPDEAISGLEYLSAFRFIGFACSNISKRSIWEENKLRFKEGILCEDLEIVIRLLSHINRMSSVRDKVYPYLYKIRENSSTTQNGTKQAYYFVQSFLAIKASWADYFSLDNPSANSYDYWVKQRALNILKSTAISYLYNAKIPYSEAKKIWGIYVANQLFLSNSRGSMIYMRNERIIHEIFYRTIGRSPILFKILLKTKRLFQR